MAKPKEIIRAKTYNQPLHTTDERGKPALDAGLVLMKTSGAPYESIPLNKAINHAIFRCIPCGLARAYGFPPVANHEPLIYCQHCKKHTPHMYTK